MSSTEQANDERHYILLTVAIAIGLIGVFLRFAGEAPYYSWIANVILIEIYRTVNFFVEAHTLHRTITFEYCSRDPVAKL